MDKGKKKHKTLWIIVGVVVIFLILAALGDDSSDNDEDTTRIEQSYTLKEMKQKSKSFSNIFKTAERRPQI